MYYPLRVVHRCRYLFSGGIYPRVTLAIFSLTHDNQSVPHSGCPTFLEVSHFRSVRGVPRPIYIGPKANTAKQFTGDCLKEKRRIILADIHLLRCFYLLERLLVAAFFPVVASSLFSFFSFLVCNFLSVLNSCRHRVLHIVCHLSLSATYLNVFAFHNC